MPTGASTTASAAPPMTAAEAWAKKKAAALERAARLREARAENSLGGSKSLDFLEQLAAAEQRDDALKCATPAVWLPTPETKPKPKPKPRVATPPTTPSAAAAKRKALTAEAKQFLQKQANAKAAAQRGGKKMSAAAADPSRSLPPLGYTVLGPIAAGAFSTILRCRAEAGGTVVAVKSFDNLKCARDVDVGDARDRELGVLRLLAQSVSHPHVANMLAELGDASVPHVHAVLEYSPGGSLKRYLQAPPAKGARDDAAREGLAAPIVAVGTRQLASALAHMHALGICHRDVKP